MIMLQAWIEIGCILAITAVAACAIAPWLAAIFRIGAGDTDDAPTGRLQRCLTAIEKPLLRLAGVWPTREMTAREYGVAIVVFHVAGFGLLLAILRLQEILPWNPDGTTAVPWLIALNTAASFTTNTNWQSYGGETTLSPLSQALGLTVQNFVSAASGLCVLAVLTRSWSDAPAAPSATSGRTSFAPRSGCFCRWRSSSPRRSPAREWFRHLPPPGRCR